MLQFAFWFFFAGPFPSAEALVGLKLLDRVSGVHEGSTPGSYRDDKGGILFSQAAMANASLEKDSKFTKHPLYVYIIGVEDNEACWVCSAAFRG